PLMPLLNKATFVMLDAHGIVPEEQRLAGRLVKSSLYALAERMIFRRANAVLVVTHAMEAHFRSKYPESTPAYVQYAILPAHLDPDRQPRLGEGTTRDGLRRVVYSGNLQ